jgi:CheY-like chemotaxis protein
VEFYPGNGRIWRRYLKELAEEEPVNLVISDMNMPEMDGITLARKIREKDPALPIILLTSMGNEQSRKNKNLFNVALTKPTKHQVLYKHIIEQLKLNIDVKNEVQPVKRHSRKNLRSFTLSIS